MLRIKIKPHSLKKCFLNRLLLAIYLEKNNNKVKLYEKATTIITIITIIR